MQLDRRYIVLSILPSSYLNRMTEINRLSLSVAGFELTRIFVDLLWPFHICSASIVRSSTLPIPSAAPFVPFAVASV